MNCKTCGYALWNIQRRICPECGNPFKPGDFAFITNSVRFCCPHCGQDYYGTGENGHLVPVEFDCVSCKRHIHMDETVLLPTRGVQEKQTAAPIVPWVHRQRLGFLKGWLGTIGMAIARPQRLIAAAEGTPAASSVWFAFFTWTISVVLGQGTIFALPFLLSGGGGGTWAMALGFAVWAGALVVAGAVLMLLWALVAHGLLRLTGPVASSIGRTVQVVCYASAVNSLGAVPCLGPYLLMGTLLWWAVLVAVLLAPAQRVGALRATIAGGLLPLLIVLTSVAGLVVLMYHMLGLVQSMSTRAATLTSDHAERTAAAILEYAGAHAGAGPTHAIELLISSSGSPPAITAMDLIAAPFSSTRPGTMMVGGTDLGGFYSIPDAQRQAFVDGVVASAPADRVVHRLGDFVFTYHGIDLSNPDPGLWLLVVTRDPLAPGNSWTAFGADTQVPIALADGTATLVPLEQFDAQFQAQNDLRASLGLPALPDPRTVLHGGPGPP